MKLDMEYALETVLDMCREMDLSLPYQILTENKEEIENLNEEVITNTLETLAFFDYEFVAITLLELYDIGRN